MSSQLPPYEPPSGGPAFNPSGEPTSPPGEPMPSYPPPPPPSFTPSGPPPPTTTTMATTPPNHRFALPSLIMGIVALLSAVSCLCPIFWVPFAGLCPSLLALALGGGALYTGNEARKQIETSGGMVGGRDQAQAGFIMGIVGVIVGLLSICVVLLYSIGLFALPGVQTSP